MKSRALAVACALAVGLCAFPTPAGTEEARDESRESALRRVQFEQMLAFTRARGDAFVPRSPYDPPPRIKIPDAREQFERAGGTLAAPSALAPEDQLLERAIANTYRKMLGGAGGCCPCSVAATCNDGLFCNGAEVCASGICASGPAPCDDGLPCSTDSCTENTDTCSHQPPPPDAVASLNVSRSAPASPTATLAWSSVSGASSYNVYRGTLAALGDLACFSAGVTTNTEIDGAVPARTYYYLVTSLACGESGLGSGTPNPRPPAPGCP